MEVALFVKHVPHAAALGIELVSATPGTGRCVMRQPWRAELVGDPERQIIHGGVITSLLDTLAGAAVTLHADRVIPQATLDLRIDYLRVALPRLDLIAEAECHRVTGHIAFVRGICYQGDAAEPIAHLTATFALLDGARPSQGSRA